MKILFLTIGSLTTPSTRFRVKQYLRYFTDDGITCEVKSIPHAFYKRFKLFKGLRDYDAVIIQKKLFSSFELSRIKKSNKNIIYDFDDLVTVLHPMHELTNKRIKRMKRNEKRFVATLKESHGVIAGNTFLKDIACTHNDNVFIVPTPVETRDLPTKEPSSTDELVIGWIGTKSNLFYLDHFKNVWSEIANRFPKVSLKIVCNEPYENDEINVINKPWRADEETDDLLSFDIGIMPLTEDDWSKGKCGFKLLQYMAVGLPTVASSIGTNCEITTDGVDGFLAGTDQEWIDKLSSLVEDSELRKKMAANARKLVDERYSVSICKDLLVKAIRETIAS